MSATDAMQTEGLSDLRGTFALLVFILNKYENITLK